MHIFTSGRHFQLCMHVGNRSVLDRATKAAYDQALLIWGTRRPENSMAKLCTVQVGTALVPETGYSNGQVDETYYCVPTGYLFMYYLQCMAMYLYCCGPARPLLLPMGCCA